MALDPKYISTSDLESVFLNKLTGLPLSGGRVEFYITGTNTPKNVFQLTQSPPHTFVSLGSVVTLDSIGQYSDGVNSVVVFYYPYTVTGDLELYEARVYSSDNILQFTRYDWPPLASNLSPVNEPDTGAFNYIPNGQFLIHNNSPITDSATESGIDILQIAQGGWSFKQSSSGTGTYNISFNAEPGFATGLLDSPPFSVNIDNTVWNSSDVVRDLTIQWPDVNFLSRKGATETFNLFFKGRLNSGSTAVFSVYLIWNYGTGGSSTDISPPTNVTLTTTYTTPFNVPVIIPDNSGKTIGPGSFFAIAIRGPATTSNARFTDFALTLGAATLTSVPFMTNDEQLSRAVAGWMPTPDPSGMDLYLPLILTNKGMKFDNAQVGQIIAKTQVSTYPDTFGYNELPMVGAALGVAPYNGITYVASGYNSKTGIPYQRLMNYLLLNSPAVSVSNGGVTGTIPTNVVPMYGTGFNFVTLFNNAAALTTTFLIGINTVANGGSATGVGAITIAATSANVYYTATVNSVPTAGYFWSFIDGQTGAHLVYNVWYYVDSAGSAPATPTGGNIRVAINSADTIVQVIAKTIAAVNQYQFMIPNLQGLLLRALDITGLYDLDYQTRYVEGILLNGGFQTSSAFNYLGTFEGSAFKDHTHNSAAGQFLHTTGAIAAGTDTPNSYGSAAVTGLATSPNGGGTETRPVNYSVNYFIKY